MRVADAVWIAPMHAAALSLLFLLGACGAEGTARSETFAVRDSAGIQIAKNSGPAWAEDEAWRLSPEPVLEIGVMDGALPYILNGVRDALRTADGGIVVANGGTSEIRFYDASGKHVRSTGRDGDGPGEFRRLGWIDLLPGDSLLAYDRQAARLSTFSPDGEFIRSVGMAPSADRPIPEPLATFADGSVFARIVRWESSGETKTGAVRSPIAFLRYAAGGDLLDSIAVLPGDEIVIGEAAGIILTVPVMLGRSTSAAVSGDDVYLGANDTFEVGMYSSDGRLKRLIRRLGELTPVTAEDKDRLLERMRGETERPGIGPAVKQILDAMPWPDTRPAFESLLADDEGNLWVEETRLFEEPSRWTVFDTDGRMLGTIGLPNSFQPVHIGKDFVLGIARDELGVERVRMYALDKG